MNKFIALPVGQGDAFYLKRDDLQILVDGGRNKTKISHWMNTICNTDCLDVLVCTHNDADHANGVIGILDNWEGKINEVWLPGSWTYRIQDLFSNPEKFLIELAGNLQNALEQRSGQGDHSFESFAISFTLGKKRFNPQEHEGNITGLSEIIENSVPCECIEICRMYPRDLDCLCNRHFRKSNTPLFWQAIKAAKNIRQIVKLAYRRNCKIRFFEYGPIPCGGKPGQLEPVNAQEIIQIHSNQISALEYLALSVVNKESLVFYSPEDETNPAVLFTADSDLDFRLPNFPPSRRPIVTAPHHGAAANAKAYAAVSAWLNNNFPFWVRSDCKTRFRPGKEFKKQNYRFCTLCNTGGNNKQSVELHSKSGCWQLNQGLQPCSCI